MRLRQDVGARRVGQRHAEPIFDNDDLALGDQPVVDVNIDRIADPAVERQYRAPSDLEQLGNLNLGAAENGGNLDGTNFEKAASLFEDMALAEDFPTFLTIPAYQMVVEGGA